MNIDWPSHRLVKRLFQHESHGTSVPLSTGFPGVQRKVLLPSETVFVESLRDARIGDLGQFMEGGRYQTPEVYAAELSTGSVCLRNNVLLTPGGHVVLETAGPGHRDAGVRWDRIPKRSSRVRGLCTLLRCPFHSFYHTIVDEVSRFALLTLPYFRRFNHIRVLVSDDLNGPERYMIDRLRPDNVEVVSLRPGRRWQPDSYLFLSFVTGKSCGYIPPPVVRAIRNVMDDVAAPRRRLLVSRAKARMRRLVNHNQLLAALRPFGFEEVVLEDLPFARQVELFQEAQIVVAPHGAGLANTLFMQEGSIVELHGTPLLAPHYATLAASAGHNYEPIFGNESNKNVDFTVDVDRVVKTVGGMLERLGAVRSTHAVAS